MTDSENQGSNRTADLEHPRQILNYRILDVLGEGGMAFVYLAEQSEPVKRRVALKILKAGMDSKQVLARFESERQALAVLDHPGIAKIFDGGIAESGRPFFVMEWIKGVPITDYCDDQCLDTRERIRLFIEVCSAVQHAHVKGLIHRDLKPSNILVSVADGSPQPKVIDFGIAKATSTTLTEITMMTRVGQAIGTPQYMSPEQAGLTGLDIDTRSDIYSLGVVLYEMLVGAVPVDLIAINDGAVGVALREMDPPTPSTRYTQLGDTRDEIARVRRTDPDGLRRELKGDLDWVVMKAIEKNRSRRYETVNALAMECHRYLEHQPVLARPPSAGYLLRRFIRRNRIAVVATSIAMLAVVAGAAVATIGFFRATEAERLAREEAETVRQVSEFLTELFEVSDPSEARGNSVTAREILDKGAKEIESALSDQPVVKAAMLETMGNVYANLGLNESATVLLTRAHEIASALFDDGDSRLTRIERSLGEHYFDLGRYDDAERLLLSTLEKDTVIFGRESTRVAYVLNALTGLYLKLDQLDEARRYAEESLAVRLALHGDSSDWYASGLHALARVMREQGEYATALEHAKEALSIWERTLPEFHPRLGSAYQEISINLSEQERLEEQEPYLLKALEIDRQTFGPEHRYYANTLEHVGIFYAKQGKFSEAEPYFLESLETSVAALGEVHDSVAFRHYNLGYFYGDLGQFDNAEKYLRSSIDIWTEVFHENHGSNAWAWNALAQNYSKLKQFDAAREAANRALQINELTYGPDHQNTSATLLVLANIARDQARYDEALPLYRRVLDNTEARFGESGVRTLDVLREYLAFLEAAGMEVEAVQVRARLGGTGE